MLFFSGTGEQIIKYDERQRGPVLLPNTLGVGTSVAAASLRIELSSALQPISYFALQLNARLP